MDLYKLTVLIMLALVCSSGMTYGRKRPGRSNKKDKKFPPASLQRVTTCMGQAVDLSSQLESSVEKCLNTRIQDVQEGIEANGKGNDKGAKKREKRLQKMTKKIQRKCLPECEWSTFNLIPDVNETTTYPAVDIPDEFLKLFPEETKTTLQTRMQTCYNTTAPLFKKEGKKAFMQKLCFTNIRLVKCLSKTVRQTCKGRTSAPENSDATKSGTSSDDGPTTPSSKEVPADDDNDNDDIEEDDDIDDIDNDEESTTGPTSPTKGTPPSTPVDTSERITK